ncbi:hypothetical protein FRC08_011180 [Ceratobasidium sp. 394]|nr:hypothetical protein FRC08_011180 [Ceratobasidium sp. 394]
MTELLQAIAMGVSPSPQNNTNLSSEFQPTSAAIVINVTWFLSLSLSMLVALVGMLVKQWGESYQSGQGLTPPCVQARVRQSRFDKLIEWRTEDIVLALPVVMHIALGLFLVGLLLFLWDLNHIVALPVMVIIAIGFTFYGLTTLLPLAVAFCPYNTPLSSRKLWAYLCRMIWSSTHSEDNTPVTRCEWEEKEISEKITPDGVTGRALDWLIKHSEDESIVDVAIRAIAGADLPKDVWDLLAKDSLIVLVAQKFTALFGGTLDSEIAPGRRKETSSVQAADEVEDSDNQLEIMSLYGRALTNIAKHRRPIDAAIGVENGSESRFGSNPIVPLTPDQTQAVTRGLHRLASSRSSNIAAFGITSISAWYMFTMETRIQWKNILAQSFRLILAHVKGETRVRSDALAGLMHSLPIEISYWKQDLSKTEKRELLLPLVEVLNQDHWVEQIREGLPLVLAVLAISVNDYPDLYTHEEFAQWERMYETHGELVQTHFAAAEIWKHSPSYYHSGISTHHDPVNRAGWRTWRAQQAARIYTIYPHLRKEHAEPLLLLGLAGLLGSLGVLGLEDKSTDITATIARQFHRISILNNSQSVTLPLVLPFSFDIRAYAVDCVIQALRPSRYRDRKSALEDDAKINLLTAFSEKPRIWADFSAQLALPVVELLHITENHLLQKQCLVSMEEHSLTKPSPREWELFSSYEIPVKLVGIAKTDPQLRSRAISNFEAFSRHLDEANTGTRISKSDILRSLILNDLFETMVMEIIFRPGSKYMAVWKEAILGLPGRLKAGGPTDGDGARCLALLTQFCDRPFSTGEVNRFVLMLKNQLES